MWYLLTECQPCHETHSITTIHQSSTLPHDHVWWHAPTAATLCHPRGPWIGVLLPLSGICFGHLKQVALISMDLWLALTEFNRRTWHRIPSLDTEPLVLSIPCQVVMCKRWPVCYESFLLGERVHALSESLFSSELPERSKDRQNNFCCWVFFRAQLQHEGCVLGNLGLPL
jgi:hypothetical protein